MVLLEKDMETREAGREVVSIVNRSIGKELRNTKGKVLKAKFNIARMKVYSI